MAICIGVLHPWSEQTEVFRTGGIKEGQYIWIRDLLELQASEVAHRPIPGSQVASPLTGRWEAWEHWLADHPDKVFVKFILDGIQTGFRIGFKGDVALKSAMKNLPSAGEHREVVRDYLEKEHKEGRVRKVEGTPRQAVHVSPFGVIPKKGQGKWRLIVDLSHPKGHSINDGIREDTSSLSFVSVDNIAEVIIGLGPQTVLAKCDVRSAYRNVPVHPHDVAWLGLQWEGETFVDTALPFGLQSAPKLFTAVADAFQYTLQAAGSFSTILTTFSFWAGQRRSV